MPFQQEETRRIAKLAHLALDETEIAEFTPQLAGILSYVEQLNELDTAGLESVAGGLGGEERATSNDRDDTPHPSLPRDAVLSEAPDASEGYFRVPRVLARSEPR